VVLLGGDCQIPVFGGREQIGPQNMARIWQSEPSAPGNPKEPENLSAWRIHSPTVTDTQLAIDIQMRYSLSFWDAMIIQSAVRLGCDTVWSEDMNTGQRYENVLVANPFA